MPRAQESGSWSVAQLGAERCCLGASSGVSAARFVGGSNGSAVDTFSLVTVAK